MGRVGYFSHLPPLVTPFFPIQGLEHKFLPPLLGDLPLLFSNLISALQSVFPKLSAPPELSARPEPVYRIKDLFSGPGRKLKQLFPEATGCRTTQKPPDSGRVLTTLRMIVAITFY